MDAILRRQVHIVCPRIFVLATAAGAQQRRGDYSGVLGTVTVELSIAAIVGGTRDGGAGGTAVEGASAHRNLLPSPLFRRAVEHAES